MATFTPEDQAMLDDLTHRKNHVAWQEREAARIARLAALAALVPVFTAEAVTPIAVTSAIQAEALAETDPEVAGMLSSLATVVGFSGQAIVALLNRLATPEPEPVAPEAAAPAEDTAAR